MCLSAYNLLSPRDLSAKTVLPRHPPLASRSGPQKSVSGDKTIANRTPGLERAGGRDCAGWDPQQPPEVVYMRSLNTLNQLCVSLLALVSPVSAAALSKVL